MSPHERWARAVNYPEAYIKPPIRTLRTWACRAYVHIGNEKLRPRARKMMPTARLGRLYGYEGIHGKVYVVRLDNGKIIRVRDVRFHEGGVPGGGVEEEALPEAVFDEEAEELTPGAVRFRTTLGSGESPAPRAPVTSRFQETEAQAEPPIDEPTAKERVMQSNLPSPPPTPRDPIDEAVSDDSFRSIEPDEVRSIESEGPQVPPREKKVDNTLGDTLQEGGNTRRPRRTATKTTSYDVTSKKGFMTNNKGKALVHMYQEDICEPPADEVYPPLADGLIMMAVAPPQSSKPKVKAPPLPKNYWEAVKQPDFREQWLPAMELQYNTLQAMGTWTLEYPPEGAQVIDGQWVLDQKFDADGNWVRNRARWVVCGNQQANDTASHLLYSAVVYSSTLRVIYTIIAVYDLEAEVFDIVAAYLNANVPEGVTIFMRQPRGLDDGTGRACRLKKALYGLRGSPKWWYDTIVPVLRKYGFEAFISDICCFIDRDKGIFLCLYVDDIMIAAPTKALIAQTKKELAGVFEMKELGELRRYLGCRIDRNREERLIYISQGDFITKSLEKYGYGLDLHPVQAPWPANTQIPKIWTPDEQADTKQYVSEVATLNFAATITRPDIQYTTNRLAEANKGPAKEHVAVLKHLWRYMAGTKSLGLRAGGRQYISNLHLHAYGDASFADDLLTRVSTGGHVVFLAGCPVIWKSKKQTIVTISTTEAEFINLTPTALSIKWIAQICAEAGYPQGAPLLVHTDSQNARLAVLNPLQTARTRHIDIRYKWINQEVEKGQILLEFVGTAAMKADGLTKALDRVKHAVFVRQLGLATHG